MSKKKVLLRGVFINRDTNGEGVLKVGTTLIRMSTVMGILYSYHLTKGEQLEAILNSTFKQLEDITDVHEMTNAQLKRLINKIEVDRDVNVDIYLRLIDDLGLDETVLIEGDENKEEKEIKADPNCHNHT